MNNNTEIKRGFWTNGNLKYETPYVNGIVHGINKWWHDNGQLECEYPFVYGKFYGIRKLWNSKGQFMGGATYKNRILHGCYIDFKH